MGLLLLLFFTVPLIEIYLLIKVGGIIGALPTVALVVFTAVLGATLMRVQGLSTLNRVRTMMMNGQVPAIEALEGAALLVGGALLLTPGFFTDTLGFLIMIPPLRRRFIIWMLKRGVLKVAGVSHRRPRGHHDPNVIEGEYRREKWK